MFRLILRYVRFVDSVNYRIGRVVMYGIFVMMGDPALVVDLQDLLSALALDAGNGAVRDGRLLHARRPLFDPAGLECADGPALRRLVDRAKRMVDAITVLFLIVYLASCSRAAGTAIRCTRRPVTAASASRDSRLAALSLADQVDHGRRHLPDAAAGDSEFFKDILRIRATTGAKV